jgi:hypothetical protein
MRENTVEWGLPGVLAHFVLMHAHATGRGYSAHSVCILHMRGPLRTLLEIA